MHDQSQTIDPRYLNPQLYSESITAGHGTGDLNLDLLIDSHDYQGALHPSPVLSFDQTVIETGGSSFRDWSEPTSRATNFSGRDFFENRPNLQVHGSVPGQSSTLLGPWNHLKTHQPPITFSGSDNGFNPGFSQPTQSLSSPLSPSVGPTQWSQNSPTSSTATSLPGASQSRTKTDAPSPALSFEKVPVHDVLHRQEAVSAFGELSKDGAKEQPKLDLALEGLDLDQFYNNLDYSTPWGSTESAFAQGLDPTFSASSVPNIGRSDYDGRYHDAASPEPPDPLDGVYPSSMPILGWSRCSQGFQMDSSIKATESCLINFPPFDSSLGSDCYVPQSEGQTSTNPIAIENSSSSHHFRPEVASSFPPTKGFLPPEYRPHLNHVVGEGTYQDVSTSPRSKATVPRSGRNQSGSPLPRTLPLRRRSGGRRRSTVAANERPSLSAITECGRSGTASPTVPSRGRRNGPLDPIRRQQAAKIRNSKTACMRCRVMKQPCSGCSEDSACVSCRGNANAKLWKQPCMRAHFLEIVEGGTCNYISQRFINHLTLDKSHRVAICLPETFDLALLIASIGHRKHKFNYHLSNVSGSLYTLDLEQCHRFLSRLHQTGTDVYELRDFIDNRLLKVKQEKEWQFCVKDFDSSTCMLTRLINWGTMPSRMTYEIVPVTGDQSRQPLDVEDSNGAREIRIAAQIARIICRLVEIAGFSLLQKELNNFNKGAGFVSNTPNFVKELGQILGSLRWRVSWWTLFGDGSDVYDVMRERFRHRTVGLTKVLYFYYCNAQNKLPPFGTSTPETGVMSYYADADPVWDDFPSANSIEGFNEWMHRGLELINGAGVQQRLPQRYAHF